MRRTLERIRGALRRHPALIRLSHRQHADLRVEVKTDAVEGGYLHLPVGDDCTFLTGDTIVVKLSTLADWASECGLDELAKTADGWDEQLRLIKQRDDAKARTSAIADRARFLAAELHDTRSLNTALQAANGELHAITTELQTKWGEQAIELAQTKRDLEHACTERDLAQAAAARKRIALRELAAAYQRRVDTADRLADAFSRATLKLQSHGHRTQLHIEGAISGTMKHAQIVLNERAEQLTTEATRPEMQLGDSTARTYAASEMRALADRMFRPGNPLIATPPKHRNPETGVSYDPATGMFGCVGPVWGPAETEAAPHVHTPQRQLQNHGH